MSYKSTPPDYEPITRRGQKALEERDPQEGLLARRGSSRNASSVDADDRPLLTHALEERTYEDGLLGSGKPAGRALASNVRSSGKKEGWTSKRGHALSFAGLFLFTLVLYFRPYELFKSLSAFNSLAFGLP